MLCMPNAQLMCLIWSVAPAKKRVVLAQHLAGTALRLTVANSGRAAPPKVSMSDCVHPKKALKGGGNAAKSYITCKECNARWENQYPSARLYSTRRKQYLKSIAQGSSHAFVFRMAVWKRVLPRGMPRALQCVEWTFKEPTHGAQWPEAWLARQPPGNSKRNSECWPQEMHPQSLRWNLKCSERRLPTRNA